MTCVHCLAALLCQLSIINMIVVTVLPRPMSSARIPPAGNCERREDNARSRGLLGTGIANRESLDV